MGRRWSCWPRLTLRTCCACVTFRACCPGRPCRTLRSSWAGVALRASCTGCPCGTSFPLEIDISAPGGAGIEPKACTRPLMGGGWTRGTGWALRSRFSSIALCPRRPGSALGPSRTLRPGWAGRPLRSCLPQFDDRFRSLDAFQEELSVSNIDGEFSGSELRRAGHSASHGGAFDQNGVCHD